MIKQWRNENLGVNYFYLPNSKNGEILTSDGVLIPYDEFKSMTSETYNAKKNTNGGYDYVLSKQSERLVKKAVNKIEEAPNTTSNITSSSKVKRVKNPIQLTDKARELLKAERSTKTIAEKTVEPTKAEMIVEPKKVEVEEKKKEFNLFDFVYPKLMIGLTIICSTLSIYFTGTYLQRLQTTFVAYAISTAILVYGLVGSQMTRRAWKNNHKLSAIIFGFTTICTIGFSMLSSVDVNYAKYKDRHSVIEETYNVNEGKKLSFDLLKDELNENKKQIELLNEDIKFQQTQWSIMWDSELMKNVVLEGRISATAQQKISDNNIRIEELNNRNKEINSKLMDYAESGVSVEKVENETDRAKSLCDLIGAIMGISANIIQLIFLLVPSFFIDAINVLSLQIYCQKFEK